jgi:hypothetical protein
MFENREDEGIWLWAKYSLQFCWLQIACPRSTLFKITLILSFQPKRDPVAQILTVYTASSIVENHKGKTMIRNQSRAAFINGALFAIFSMVLAVIICWSSIARPLLAGVSYNMQLDESALRHLGVNPTSDYDKMWDQLEPPKTSGYRPSTAQPGAPTSASPQLIIPLRLLAPTVHWINLPSAFIIW